MATRNVFIAPFLSAARWGFAASLWLSVCLPIVAAVAAPPASARQATEPSPSAADDFDLSAHQTLSRVNLLIRENYVEPDRVKPYDMFMAALDYIQRTVPEVMVDDAEAPARIKLSVGGTSQDFELGQIDQLWEVTMALRDIFRFLQLHVADKQEQRNIEWAAINGMLSTLDPHSVLLKPESFDEMKLSTRGEFGGLGIVISLRDGALTIISPIEGTPASQAGLQAKDKIVKIGVESTVNMGLDEAVQRLRGEPDSKVDISVLRKGWSESRPFTLTRAIIKIESVSAKLLEGEVGYVKIKSFQGNTFEDLTHSLDRLKAENKNADLKGLVLDLRNNPGGLLDQAILVSDRFIEKGPLVITVGEGNRRREVKYARKGPDEMTYPIVVLLNGGSASASEIVAGGLKNHDRAVVIGQQSFGKGSVQVLYDLEKSGLKLTIAQYLTPGDLSIQSIGVVPDVLVTPAYIEAEGIRLFVDDDSLREKDLSKHLEQHGVSKLAQSCEKMFHLVREPTDNPNAPAMAQQEAANGLSGAGDTGDANTAKQVTTGHKAGPDGGAKGQRAAAHGSDDADIDPVVREMTGAFHYDFETQLAHDLLRRVKSLSRPLMLEQAASLLAERSAEQDRRIAERMGELGIDWRLGPNPAAVSARVVLRHNAKDGAIQAGEVLTLTAEVENTGAEPLYRLWGATQSENPLLKHLEFAFGYVAPHEKKSWSVDVKLPKDLLARADEVTLDLGPPSADKDKNTQSNGAVATGAAAEKTKAGAQPLGTPKGGTLSQVVMGKVFVTITEQKKPVFSFRTAIVEQEGNNDGCLQAGERVKLFVDVTNTGDGVAEETTVIGKNLSGQSLFLDTGRYTIGRLAPGETKRAELGFLVFGQAAAKQAEQNARSEGDDRSFKAAHTSDLLSLRLMVWDGVLGASVTEKLSFKVAPPSPMAALLGTLVAKKGPVTLYSGACEGAPILGTLAKGGELGAEGRFGRFGRVDLGGGEHAFVSLSDVASGLPKRTAKAGSKAPPSATALESRVRRAEGTAAPLIELEPTALIIDEEVFHLRGSVTDTRPLKDMFVFVGDKKVFFRFLQGTPLVAGTYRHHFDVPIKLKVGTNAVGLFVRENEELAARRLFFVHRTEQPVVPTELPPEPAKRATGAKHSATAP